MTASDEQLWQSYVEGDRSAFTTLVHRYSRELFAFLTRFVNDPGIAEDLVQETFLQVHASAATFEAGRAFRPWLFTVAANKARDRLRLKQRRPETLVGGPAHGATDLFDLLRQVDQTPETDVSSEEATAQVRRLLAEMPDSLREILVLSYYQQTPYRDIAQTLGIPVGTVKSRVHAAVKWLAERWRRQDGDPGNTPTLGRELGA